MCLREAELPKFDDDPDNFWCALYRFEQQTLAQQLAAQNAQPAPAVQPRAAEDDINFVINELTKKNVAEEIINAWRGILAGTIAIRNWIEHGNYLTDRDDYEPGKKETLLQNRQKVVRPIMIRLILSFRV